MKPKAMKKRNIEIVKVGSNEQLAGKEQVSGEEQVHGPRKPFTASFATKKPRGKGRCVDATKLRPDERIKVRANRFGQPIHASGVSFARFLGLVARNCAICPLNYLKWSDMPDQTKADQIAYIKSKYMYDDYLDSWTNKSLAAKWRGYKTYLKGKWFKPDKSEEWNCTYVPPNVVPQQWHFLVKHFLSPKGKKLSEIGVRSRNAQKANHTCGSLSFANKIDEMENESGSHVGAITFFKVSRTTKDDEDKLIDEEAERILEEAETIFKGFKEANPNASADELFLEEQEIMTQVRGKEVSGRVRGLGLGPTPTQLGMCTRGSSRYRNEDVDAMRKRMTDLEGQLAFLIDIVQKSGLYPVQDMENASYLRAAAEGHHNSSSSSSIGGLGNLQKL